MTEIPTDETAKQILIRVRRVGPRLTSLVELVALDAGLGLRITNDLGDDRLSTIQETEPLEAIWSHPALHRIDPQRQTEFEVDPSCNLTEAAIARSFSVEHDTHPVDPLTIDDLPPRATGAVVTINEQVWVELDETPPGFVRWDFSSIVFDEPWAQFSYDVPSSGSNPYRKSIGISNGVIISFVEPDLDDNMALDFVPTGRNRLAVLADWLLDLDRNFPGADSDGALMSLSINIDDIGDRD